MQTIKLEKSITQNKIEVWKSNPKGFFNFIKYINEVDIKKIKREFKNCQIIDKTK